MVNNLVNGYQLWYNTENETRRGGLLIDGTWTSNASKEQKPVIAARDLFMFANDILENFSYGSREIEINPIYKELGWDNYWKNEEWYNDENAKVMMIFR